MKNKIKLFLIYQLQALFQKSWVIMKAQKSHFVMQHDLTPRIHALHKITIALKFMSYINQKLRSNYQTALNLCLT